LSEKALLTFSIGPVHGFIAQARRVADLWAGSALLSHLTGTAVEEVLGRPAAEMIFPRVAPGEPLPPGITNRFVCRVPLPEAGDVAKKLEQAVRAEWNRLVATAVSHLREREIAPSAEIWTDDGEAGSRQTDHLLEIAWSWVPEEPSYASASRDGARRFAASRLFRPFPPGEEAGEKCAICGERAALPDGKRENVRQSWKKAADQSQGTVDERYFRLDQGRLCLVCATKRLYPRQSPGDALFASFQDFEPSENRPYFAIVAMDGDHMGQILGWPESRISGGTVKEFHQAVSEALSRFAAGLRTPGKADLNLETLGQRARPAHKRSQLVYAGGEDVLLVCDPREALRLAWSIREVYRRALRSVVPLLADPGDFDAHFTISAGILFAHTKHPAGLLFRDVEDLLKRKAKREANRDAVAMRLAKRGGVPVETAFKWQEPTGSGEGRLTWVQAFDQLISELDTGALSSRQTFNLRREEKVLFETFAETDKQKEEERWTGWLRDRLSRREDPQADPGQLAHLLAPFFVHRKTGALRILRFLVRELAS